MTRDGEAGDVAAAAVSEVEELVGPSVADMGGEEEDGEEEPMAGPMPPKPKKRKVPLAWSCHNPRLASPAAPTSASGPRPLPVIWLYPCLYFYVQTLLRHRAGLLLLPRAQVLAFESNYLDALPSAEMYERSYMHRDEIHHIVVRPPSPPRGGASCTTALPQASMLLLK